MQMIVYNSHTQRAAKKNSVSTRVGGAMANRGGARKLTALMFQAPKRNLVRVKNLHTQSTTDTGRKIIGLCCRATAAGLIILSAGDDYLCVSHLESAEDASGREFAEQRRRWFAAGGGGGLLHDFGHGAQPSVHLVQPHGHALHLRLLRAHQLVHFGVEHLEPLLTPMEIDTSESSKSQNGVLRKLISMRGIASFCKRTAAVIIVNNLRHFKFTAPPYKLTLLIVYFLQISSLITPD
jgi:hypothetical protein